MDTASKTKQPTSQGPPAALRVDNIDVGPLSAVSFTVPAGAVVTLSGVSGSGKSRLLRAIADLEPHGGDVFWGDARQSECPPAQWRSKVMMLGETADSAIGDIRREAMRSGMMPAINAMAAAGIVSLPGMMTGQILAGTSPLLAVKYQILIMLTITVGSGLGTVLAVVAGSRRLFDDRQRLRLDRLVTSRH